MAVSLTAANFRALLQLLEAVKETDWKVSAVEEWDEFTTWDRLLEAQFVLGWLEVQTMHF